MREMRPEDQEKRDEWRRQNPMWCRHCEHGPHPEKCPNCPCEDWDF